MVPRFSVGDFVSYENKVYEIKNSYVINYYTKEDTFFYGLVLCGCDPIEPVDGKQLLVREEMLEKATEQQIQVWKILFSTLPK